MSIIKFLSISYFMHLEFKFTLKPKWAFFTAWIILNDLMNVQKRLIHNYNYV
jgi:hypothetical protein